MDLAGHPQLEQPSQRPLDVFLTEKGDELVAQADAGEVPHKVHIHAALCETLRLLVHAETVAVLVAHRPEDPGGVLDEAQIVEHADDPVSQVAEPAKEIDHRAEFLSAQGDGHGVDGEVSPEQVLTDGSVFHAGQRGRMVVELGTGGGDIDVERLTNGPHPRGRFAEHRRVGEARLPS